MDKAQMDVGAKPPDECVEENLGAGCKLPELIWQIEQKPPIGVGPLLREE